MGQTEEWAMDARGAPARRLAGVGVLVVAAMSVPHVASSPLWLLIAGSLAGTAFVVAMSRQARDLWVMGLPAGMLLVASLVAITDLSAWPDRLVWERADQVALTEIALAMLRGEANRFHYLLAMPAALAAIIAVAGFDGTSIDIANRVNLLLMPTMIGVAVPASFGLLGRSALPGRLAYVWATLLSIPVLAYLAFPPGWIPERNADLVPRRMSGLVYAPEVFAWLLTAVGIYVLARRNWSWLVLGVTIGSIVAVHERHLLIALPLLGLLLTLDRRAALRTALVAAACLVPQLAYFRVAYGGWLFPNRSHTWDERTVSWAARASDRYDVETDAPGRLDLAYVSTNLPDVLVGSWWFWLLSLVGLVAACWFRRSDWRLWLFCGVLVVSVVISSAAYINLVVQWRYNFLAVPPAAFPAVATVATVWANRNPSSNLRQMGRRS